MANDQKPIISVRKLRKVYMMGQEHVVALHNIDIDIPWGEVCCIFGTSGSGKSTLLNQLAGLEKPTRGVVRIGGVPISQLNENQLAAYQNMRTQVKGLIDNTQTQKKDLDEKLANGKKVLSDNGFTDRASVDAMSSDAERLYSEYNTLNGECNKK